jgi:hypothetical protein
MDPSAGEDVKRYLFNTHRADILHVLPCLRRRGRSGSSGCSRLPSTNAPHYEQFMQDHSFSFEGGGTPQEIWTLFWGHRQRIVQHGDMRIEYLHWGDEVGEGRIRHCHFRVPRYLLSGGIGRSRELGRSPGGRCG